MNSLRGLYLVDNRINTNNQLDVKGKKEIVLLLEYKSV